MLPKNHADNQVVDITKVLSIGDRRRYAISLQASFSGRTYALALGRGQPCGNVSCTIVRREGKKKDCAGFSVCPVSPINLSDQPHRPMRCWRGFIREHLLGNGIDGKKLVTKQRSSHGEPCRNYAGDLFVDRFLGGAGAGFRSLLWGEPFKAYRTKRGRGYCK